MTGGTSFELPWPHKILWPNGSVGNRYHKVQETTKHQQWAWAAAMAELKPGSVLHAKLAEYAGERIPVLLTFCPKPRGPEPDRDNCMASAKAYLDGIAKAMGVDDRLFDPTVAIGPRGSKIVVSIGGGDA